jgi:hypothetical protein
MVCTVLPSPIWSAKMPSTRAVTQLQSACSQCRSKPLLPPLPPPPPPPCFLPPRALHHYSFSWHCKLFVPETT